MIRTERVVASALCLLALVLGSPGAQSDKEFLLMVEKDTFLYFTGLINKENGLVPDSSRFDTPCSIAAQGFGLTAFCIGAENGWIPKETAYKLILTSLKTYKNSLAREHGFYYHFMDMKTGQRVWECELSSIDTVLFIAGALTAGEYFKGTEVEKLANEIYAGIDWEWMLNGRKTLCMGWKPDTGFLPYYWSSYSELMILYALAIGAPKHAIPAECWDAWARPIAKYKGKEFIYCPTGSAFVYQFSHAWIDFRGRRDKYADYWENSVKGIWANWKYCVDNRHKYEGFEDNMWGVSACIGPKGYKGYGAGPGTVVCDGTIAPAAAGGSVPFMPGASIDALRRMYEDFGSKVYTQYGFVDSFNIGLDWWAQESLGIDSGITLLMIENYRTGFVWKYFMRHPAVQKWLELCFNGQTSAPAAR